MKNRLLILISFIKYSPIILFRYFKFLILNKQIIVKEFRPNNAYCIDGSLNQLIWNIENSLFVTLENSPKIYLGTNDWIFKVSSSNSNFQLKSYGYNAIIKSHTAIQVVTIKQHTFEATDLRHRISNFKSQNVKIISSQNIFNGIKKANKISSFQIKDLSLSNNFNISNLISINEPTEELTHIDNLQNIDQLNNYNYD